MASLMYSCGVEVPFYNDDGAMTGGSRFIEVKQQQRFSEARWEKVLRFFAVDRTPGIGDQSVPHVANRDHYPVMHEAGARIEADAECLSRFDADSAFP